MELERATLVAACAFQIDCKEDVCAFHSRSPLFTTAIEFKFLNSGHL